MTLDSIEWQSCREKSEVAYCNFFAAAVLPFLFPPYSIQGRRNEIFLGKPKVSFHPLQQLERHSLPNIYRTGATIICC